MPIWLSKWIQGLKQTGRFHPSWILLVVLTTGVVAGIVWIPTQMVSKAGPDRLPDAQAVPVSTPPTTNEPAPAKKLRAPAHATLASATGDFTPPDIDDLLDGDGRYAFPPLWGKDSFNAGAGMTQVHNAAAFIRANMPLGQGNTLTEQEAWDVAKFVNSHPRPTDPRQVKS